MSAHTLTLTGIARATNVSLRTIHRLIAARDIPHIKIGSRRRFSQEEVDAHFAAKKRVFCKNVA